ncbi:MAG TPA: glyceraldehyde 3-phosphate dehydrogenase NAD-binding domain-containing protein, partial [Candidatus Lokiarchaeia archaeon]|nr:glyceraldehyde 3-phosphate dehydrogenase NAD-binding domain-containing protein [Candidatus Lokiarchaeia archaeon]
MTKKVFINGFGRIGHVVLRELFKRQKGAGPAPDIEIVGINDLFPAAMSAYLFKYDSAYRPWESEVSSKDNAIIIGDQEIPYFME